jgi:hypothetical protein
MPTGGAFACELARWPWRSRHGIPRRSAGRRLPYVPTDARAVYETSGSENPAAESLVA